MEVCMLRESRDHFFKQLVHFPGLLYEAFAKAQPPASSLENLDGCFTGGGPKPLARSGSGKKSTLTAPVSKARSSCKSSDRGCTCRAITQLHQVSHVDSLVAR